MYVIETPVFFLILARGENYCISIIKFLLNTWNMNNSLIYYSHLVTKTSLPKTSVVYSLHPILRESKMKIPQNIAIDYLTHELNPI